MANKIYFATFDTEHKRDRRTHKYIFHCEAANAKEAKEKAKAAWIAAGNKRHQFHMYGCKSRLQDEKLLMVRSWTGREFKGSTVMNGCICYEVKMWPKQ